VSGKILRFLGSIRLAIVFLITLAVISVIGIVIPQGYEPHRYIHRWGARWGGLLLSGGFDRVFSTGWFQLLLGLLSVNILACSLTRMVRSLQAALRHDFSGGPEVVAAFSHSVSFTAAGTTAGQVAGEIRSHCASNGLRCAVRDDGNSVRVSCRAGALKAAGSLVFHLCIILFLAGGLVGRMGGFSYIQELAQGETAAVRQRDFSVRCDGFRLEKNDRDEVRDYKTDLAIVGSDGAELVGRTIEVNNPLTYKGVRFYQSSYGQQSERVDSVRLLAKDRARNPLGTFHTVPFAQPHQLDETGLVVQVSRFLCDFVISMQERTAANRSARHDNPAVLATVTRGADTLYSRWTFRNFPGMHKADGDIEVVMVDYTPSYATGIQVKHNPGAPIVWAALLLTTVSIMLMFYTRRVVIRAVVTPAAGGMVSVVAGGYSGGAPEAYQERLRRLADRVKAAGTATDARNRKGS